MKFKPDDICMVIADKGSEKHAVPIGDIVLINRHNSCLEWPYSGQVGDGSRYMDFKPSELEKVGSIEKVATL